MHVYWLLKAFYPQVINWKEHNASWECNSHWSNQEISPHLWNKKVHYRVWERPLQIPTLIQINPVHIPPPFFFNTCFNIIIASLAFPRDLLHALIFPLVLHIHLLDLIILKFNGEYELWRSSSWSSLYPPVISFPFCPIILLSAPFSYTIYVPPWGWKTEFDTHTKLKIKL
jgi:hypothetical protein